jgi:hypothetical protein
MGDVDGILSIDYVPTKTIRKFHRSDAPVRGIRGPIGSGKSVGCCFEIFKRCAQQEPGKDGKRKSRWAVVRNTNPQLETTTIKTWLDWFPEHIFGKFVRRIPYCHHIKFNDVEAEIYFLALDRPDDVKKLLSLELTGVWINEAREVPVEIVRGATERVGRYPSKRDGGATWYGVIMDTNPPDEDHWWAIYEGSSPLPNDWSLPIGWDFYIQPPAAFEEREGGRINWILNPEAENLDNLPDNYYQNVMAGKPNNHIRVYVGNKLGTAIEGQPVYLDEWNEDVHLAREPLLWIPGRPIIVGLDYGRSPAACFSQQTARGQWQDIHELVFGNLGAEKFSKYLVNECKIMFPDTRNFQFYGDPSGDYGNDTDERTYHDILKAEGVNVRGAGSNNWTIRKEAGGAALSRMVDGQPGYLLSPTCKVIKKGFNGAYKYKRIASTSGYHYSETPEKNESSHVHDARQYGYLGAGEGRKLIRKEWNSNTKMKPSRAKFNFKVIR